MYHLCVVLVPMSFGLLHLIYAYVWSEFTTYEQVAPNCSYFTDISCSYENSWNACKRLCMHSDRSPLWVLYLITVNEDPLAMPHFTEPNAPRELCEILKTPLSFLIDVRQKL